MEDHRWLLIFSVLLLRKNVNSMSISNRQDGFSPTIVGEQSAGKQLSESDRLVRKFDNWRLSWSTKQEVIDSLLDELERSMRMSQSVSRNALRVIDTPSTHE